VVDGLRGSGLRTLAELAAAEYTKSGRAKNSSVLHIPRDQYNWGYYFVPQDDPSVRQLLPVRPDEHAAAKGLDAAHLLRVYDKRFQTAFIVHPDKATYASAHDTGAIILYLPGASCVHSQGTAMIQQLTFFNKRGYPGVAIDHAYHGHGPQDPAFSNLNAYMSWIHSIVQYSKRMYADVPLGIFGRSTGANVALEYARRYPGEAAFTIAMSGYNPKWSPYSIYHISNMQAAGEYQINEKGLQWTEDLDQQWTWFEPTSAPFMQRNNVKILVGDRDDEYPWYAHQTEGDYAKGYRVPPEKGDPYYVAWWRDYAANIGAELLVVPNAAHNLFDTRHPRVAEQARSGVLDYLSRIVPSAGRQYFVGRPFHFADTLMKLPSSVDELRKGVQEIEQAVELSSASNINTLDLVVLYQALSRHREVPTADAAAYAKAAERAYASIFPKVREEASFLLLGRPIARDLVQVAVREMLASHDPLDLLPKTPSVAEMIDRMLEASRTADARTDDFSIRGTAYDFAKRPLTVQAAIGQGKIRQLLISGDEDALAAARALWRRNAAFLADDVMAKSHRVHRRALGGRDAVALTTLSTNQGKMLVLAPTEGLTPSNDLLLARFAEMFFEYWPHHVVRDFVRRLDKMPAEGRADAAEINMPHFHFARDDGNIYVQTPPSHKTHAISHSLGELQKQVDYQRRNPNRDVFSSRRTDKSHPSGNFERPREEQPSEAASPEEEMIERAQADVQAAGSGEDAAEQMAPAKAPFLGAPALLMPPGVTKMGV
jgi:pimeloyl-ACP methyl ester carboxylesterase